MVEYIEAKIKLSDAQKKRLMNGHAVQVPAGGVGVGDSMLLTKRQHNRMATAKVKGQGCRVQFDSSQIRKNQEVVGEGFFDDLVDGAKRLGRRALQAARPAARPVLNSAVDKLTELLGAEINNPAIAALVNKLGKRGVAAAGDRFGFGSVQPAIGLGKQRIAHGKGFLPVGQYM